MAQTNQAVSLLTVRWVEQQDVGMAILANFRYYPCWLCDSEITNIFDLMRAPIVDPYGSQNVTAIAEIVGKLLHADCWGRHPLKYEINRMMIADCIRNFGPEGRISASDVHFEGARYHHGYPMGTGVVALPSIARFFDNMFGLDVEGAVISLAASDLPVVTNFLRAFEDDKDHSFNFRSEAYGLSTLVIKHSPSAKRILIEIFSGRDRYDGDSRLSACIDRSDLQILKMNPTTL